MTSKILKIDIPFVSGQAKIFLNNDHSAWITLEYLPQELRKYAEENFQKLFDLRDGTNTTTLRNTIVEDKLVSCALECEHYYQSYLKTPPLVANVTDFKKNYMFASSTEASNTKDSVPELFQPFHKYLGEVDYNQLVINWYERDMFLKNHTDWLGGMKKEANIALVNLNRKDANCEKRTLVIVPTNRKFKKTSAYNTFNIKLHHGLIVKLYGKAKSDYSHGIPLAENQVDRIGVTFRSYE